MSRILAKIALFAALLVLAGCREWMEDEGPGTGIPVPTGTCLCAQVCGVQVIDNTHWVDPSGTRQGLGLCYPATADQLQRGRPACDCAYFSRVPSPYGRPSPNH